MGSIPASVGIWGAVECRMQMKQCWILFEKREKKSPQKIFEKIFFFWLYVVLLCRLALLSGLLSAPCCLKNKGVIRACSHFRFRLFTGGNKNRFSELSFYRARQGCFSETGFHIGMDRNFVCLFRRHNCDWSLPFLRWYLDLWNKLLGF